MVSHFIRGMPLYKDGMSGGREISSFSTFHLPPAAGCRQCPNPHVSSFFQQTYRVLPLGCCMWSCRGGPESTLSLAGADCETRWLRGKNSAWAVQESLHTRDIKAGPIGCTCWATLDKGRPVLPFLASSTAKRLRVFSSSPLPSPVAGGAARCHSGQWNSSLLATSGKTLF